MAIYIENNNRSRVGYIEGDRVEDSNHSVIGYIAGNSIKDRNNSSVGCVAGGRIENTNGATVGYISGDRIENSSRAVAGYINGYATDSQKGAAGLLLLGLSYGDSSSDSANSASSGSDTQYSSGGSQTGQADYFKQREAFLNSYVTGLMSSARELIINGDYSKAIKIAGSVRQILSEPIFPGSHYYPFSNTFLNEESSKIQNEALFKWANAYEHGSEKYPKNEAKAVELWRRAAYIMEKIRRRS